MMTPFDFELAIQEELLLMHIFRSLAEDFDRAGKPDECHGAHVDADYHWHRACDFKEQRIQFARDAVAA